MSRLLFSVCVSLIPTLCANADWNGFRGDGSGVSPEKDLPAKWSKGNINWKVKLPGLGSSSPIVVKDRVFVTGYSGYGVKLTKGFKGGSVFKRSNPGDQKNLKLWILCLDREKGDTLWKKEIKPKLPVAKFSGFLREHGYASSTPISDGERVYFFFGKTGVFAFDLNGKQLWHADVGDGIHQWGSATSPVLTRNAVVVNASIESQSLIALDKKTGKELWRQKDILVCWPSPAVVNLKNGKQQVVLNSPTKIMGVDAESGKLVWHCKGLGGKSLSTTTVSTPTVHGETIYIMTAGPYVRPTVMALKAGGSGDVTKTHVLWKVRGGSGICSPVVHKGKIYWVDGVAYCMSTDKGKVLTSKRIYDAQGEYASAIVADGKIFAVTRFDGVFVLAEGKKLEVLARNNFEGDDSIFNATPAISDGQIFIRSNEYIYSIGK